MLICWVLIFGLKHEYVIASKKHDMALKDYKNTIEQQISTHLDPISRNASEMAHMFRETFLEISNSLCSNKEKRDLCFHYSKFEERKKLCKDPNSSSPPYPKNNSSNLH